MEELDRKEKPEHVKDILARMVPDFEKQRSESDVAKSDVALKPFKATFNESSPVVAIIALRIKDNSPEARKSAYGKR